MVSNTQNFIYHLHFWGYSNGNSVKERFSINGSYMIDSKDRFIGMAKFDLPKNLKDERIIVNIIIQGIYNSGAGLIPSIPRTIKREILCQ